MHIELSLEPSSLIAAPSAVIFTHVMRTFKQNLDFN